jgi:hypothetical protein
MSSGDENPLVVGRVGPVFDNAWRLLFEGRAEAVAAFVTGEPIESFAGARFLTADLAGTTLSADALIEVGGRRLHVELQLLADAVRFEPRLVNYWARLNTLSKVPFEQHVIVMNPRGGRLSGSYRRGRLQLEYFVHHLWDVPVEKFLTHETLFPFAVLGDVGSTAERGAVLHTVVERVQSAIGVASNDGLGHSAGDAERTIEIAATLASIYLSRSTIREILERNNNMTVLLRDFPLSQSFIEEGRQEGRLVGVEEGRVEMLLTVARARHGELSERLVEALTSSNRGMKELSEMVLSALDQAELENLLET